MSLLGQSYRDLFLSCVKEGYDHAYNVLQYGGEFKCPYEDLDFDSYEYDAWWMGVDWYRSRVH